MRSTGAYGDPDRRGISQAHDVVVGGNRVTITGGGIVHDMRCDGTLEHGVHDVAAADFTTPVDVVAAYENGVHVLRLDGGFPVEVRRWREGDDVVSQYVG